VVTYIKVPLPLLLCSSSPPFLDRHCKTSTSHPHRTAPVPSRGLDSPTLIYPFPDMDILETMNRDMPVHSDSAPESERPWTPKSQSNPSSSEDEEPDQAVNIMEPLINVILLPSECSPTHQERPISEPLSPSHVHFDAESSAQRPSSAISDPPLPPPPSSSCNSHRAQDRGRTRVRKPTLQPRDGKKTTAPRYILAQRVQRCLDRSLDTQFHVPENKAETPVPEADKPYPTSASDKLDHHVDENGLWDPISPPFWGLFTSRRRGAVVVSGYAAREGGLHGCFGRSAC